MPQPLIGNDVYDTIRDMILSQRLRPAERLIDRTLAEMLGVSRTPVRVALGRLEEVGLVVSRARRGYFVVDITAKEAADLYDVREILETSAIRQACEFASDSDLEELDAILAEVTRNIETLRHRGHGIRIGLRLHEVIARVSGNSALHQILTRLLDRMLVFVWMEVANEDSQAAQTSLDEHRAMVEMVRKNCPDEAEKIVRQHIRTAKKNILRVMCGREAFYEEFNPDTLRHTEAAV